MQNSNGQARLNILVVDGNKDTCEAYKALLGLLGHQAEAVTTGTEAILLASSIKWHLALIGLKLPDMDGRDVTREFRARLGAGVKLVAVTGYYGTQLEAQARDAGFDHVFIKPVAFNALEGLVKMVEADHR